MIRDKNWVIRYRVWMIRDKDGRGIMIRAGWCGGGGGSGICLYIFLILLEFGA